MKNGLILLGFLFTAFTIFSCLDNEEEGYIPNIPEQTNSMFGKDSIPPRDSIEDDKPETGGEQGQNPIKP